MAAKETCWVANTIRVERYEKSILVDGQSIYLQTEVTDDIWCNMLAFISTFHMTSFNEGVESARAAMREALGL